MSEVSKKIAIYEQKSSNNNKNDKLKNGEKKKTKLDTNNKNVKNINTGQSNSDCKDFQSKISMFQQKDKNNENKQFKNNNIIKEETNKKEKDLKSHLNKKNNSNNIYNEKGKEINIQEKIKFFNKNKEENTQKEKGIVSQKTFQEKINIFTNNTNKKENEPKTKFKGTVNNFTNSKKAIDSTKKKEVKIVTVKTYKEKSDKVEINHDKNSSDMQNIINQITTLTKENSMEDLHIRKSMPINALTPNEMPHNNNKSIQKKNQNKNDKLYSSKTINLTEAINNSNISEVKENNINSKIKKSVRHSEKLPVVIDVQKDNDVVDEIGEIFLKSDIIPLSVYNNAFCMGFFVTSFNIDNPQIIENSVDFSSDCEHNICSLALAIKPEIIFRYPEKDTKDFEISELSASICFPNGIKICCNKNEMHVKGLKNYCCILTNQNGIKYYMSTYHYYLKLPTNELNTDNDYFKALDNQVINEIKSNKYVYIPHCISLLTKYPYFNQIKKCLECMRFSLQNYSSNPSEIYDLITYFLKSIPIPPVGTKLFFPVPYCKDLIIINQPFYKDCILFGDNPIMLLEYLSVEEIIIIFRLLLFEQKVLIVGKDYDVISQLTYNLILLLYPFQWTHTYISIMTEKTIKYLQSFLPFLMGMHSSLYELATNIIFSLKENNIYIININQHTFEMNKYPDLNTKNVIKKINEIVPQLPKNIYNIMNLGLGVMKSYYEKKKEQENININRMEEILIINIKIRHVFIRAFLEILYDYKNYLSVIGGKPIFNTNSLLENRPKHDSHFYKEITETQAFQWFIQNNPVNVSKKDETFFEEQLSIYLKLANKNEFREAFINNCQITCDIYKHYCIKLENIDTFDVNNKTKINIKNENELTINNYKRYINQKYFIYDSYFKPNSIHKENKIVINHKIIFDYDKFPCTYDFYIIPNQEFNFEIEKRNKSIRIKRASIKKSQANIKKNNENELSQEQKDDIKENIFDTLTKVFKNEEITDVEQNKKLIMDSLNTDYGRDLYTSILYQNKHISNEKSFNFLKDIIFNSINKLSKLKKTERKLIYIVKLAKSCQNFRKEENKRYIYLSDILFPKFQKIQLFSEFDFWKEWALIEINEKKDEKDINKRWTKILKCLMKIMPQIGLHKSVIFSTIADLAKENIKDETIFSEFMKEVLSNLQIYH